MSVDLYPGDVVWVESFIDFNGNLVSRHPFYVMEYCAEKHQYAMCCLGSIHNREEQLAFPNNVLIDEPINGLTKDGFIRTNTIHIFDEDVRCHLVGWSSEALWLKAKETSYKYKLNLNYANVKQKNKVINKFEHKSDFYLDLFEK